jgi:hypothetical protein
VIFIYVGVGFILFLKSEARQHAGTKETSTQQTSCLVYLLPSTRSKYRMGYIDLKVIHNAACSLSQTTYKQLKIVLLSQLQTIYSVHRIDNLWVDKNGSICVKVVYGVV